MEVSAQQSPHPCGPLEVLSLEVTTQCNLSCTNCFALAANQRVHMDLSQAAEIVREGRRLGFTALHITGGEPLLWPPLFDLLDLATECSYGDLLINTNGTLLNRDRALRLAGYRASGMPVRLSVSINGPVELHERVRGKGSHGRAISGIEIAVNCGLPVEVFTTVNRGLLDRIPAYVGDLFNRFPFRGDRVGITGVSLIQLHRAIGRDLTAEMLTPEDFVALVRMTALISLQGFPVSILDHALANVVAQKTGFKWLAPSRELSRYGKPILLRGGELTAHHSSRRSFGRYSPGALAEMISARDYLAETGTDDAACIPCPFRPECRSAGMTRPSESLYNNINDESRPFCRRVLELLEEL